MARYGGSVAMLLKRGAECFLFFTTGAECLSTTVRNRVGRAHLIFFSFFF
jgi:hypothetical protein